jgi:hypothetical protein
MAEEAEKKVWHQRCFTYPAPPAKVENKKRGRGRERERDKRDKKRWWRFGTEKRGGGGWVR